MNWKRCLQWACRIPTQRGARITTTWGWVEEEGFKLYMTPCGYIHEVCGFFFFLLAYKSFKTTVRLNNLFHLLMTFRKWRKFFAPQGLKCSERNWFVITISPWFDSEERSKNIRISTSSSSHLLCWACKLLLLFLVTKSCPTFCDCSLPGFMSMGYPRHEY